MWEMFEKAKADKEVKSVNFSFPGEFVKLKSA